MNPQELRIGNWLYSKITKMEFQVTADDIKNIQEDPFNILPIQITDLWLSAYGFEKEPLGFGKSIAWHEGQYKKLSFSGDYLFIREGDSDNRTEDSICVLWNKDIKKQFCIHQLQNLYFAIVGKELEAPNN